MQLTIQKHTAEKIGFKKFELFGMQGDSWKWTKGYDVDLSDFTPQKLARFKKLFTDNLSVSGSKVAVSNIEMWEAACVDASTVRPKSVRQFRVILAKYLMKAPKQRLYEKDSSGRWCAYHVDRLEFTEADRKNQTPAYVTMKLVYLELGGMRGCFVTFYEGDCRAMTVAEALARQDMFIESDMLLADYEYQKKRWDSIYDKIGKQFLAEGMGSRNLDGNPESRGSWYRQEDSDVNFVRGGSPTRVVIDVFREEEKERHERTTEADRWFWNSERRKYRPDIDKADDGEEWENDPAESIEEEPVIDVPLHPILAVFDLSKHLRCRCHVANLTEYVYDPSIVDKLILPPESKSLVKTLVEHRDGGFRDIIAGKSGGAVVLLCGPPGVGKTLTAEVFAEAESRALYSVQCSQLGIKPADLEENLLKVFTRARRWNAVCLLDEADVYVRERGGDLQQNAIVGVFLRVLEYQSAVLFLTTNRPDDVDDAIASRCIARLNYNVPNSEDQRRIWRVLSDSTGAKLGDDVIWEIVSCGDRMSGRDVKCLLKLAMLHVGAGNPITAEAVNYVKQFRPSL